MDCCSSTSYMDYRHHSMNSNFCYPYTPSMLRNASPYALAGPGTHGSARYGSAGDYRYTGAVPGYDGYEKYYGAGGGGAGAYHHPAASPYPSSYYGNYPSPAYREYGGYGGHYYHQSQSPYARAAYGGTSPYQSYPGGGRHYPLSHPFGREPYYHGPHGRDPLHHQHQYSSFASYGNLPPYHRNGGLDPAGTPEHTSIGAKTQHQQQPYPVHPSFPGNHQDRGMTGESASAGGSASLSRDSSASSAASLFNGPSSGYSPPSTDYALAPSSFSGRLEDSPPQHALGSGPKADDGSGELHRPGSATPAHTAPSSQSAGAGATATGEFPPGTKDTRMRKPKERKLQRAYGAGGVTPGGGGGEGAGGGGTGSGRASRNSSPSGTNGPSGNGSAGARIKSLDALTNLCWPEVETTPTRVRKHTNGNGLRTKETNGNRKENNDQDSPSSMASHSSPRGVVSAGRRTKKQTAAGKQSTKETKVASDVKEKSGPNEPIAPTPPVEHKNVTPLPGFQQAFGSTEIGRFSEVFFNSSPSPADHNSPAELHHPMHPEQHPDDQGHHRSSAQGELGRQQQQQQQLLAMDALSAYESDVDTLSPQPWAGPRGQGESYESPAGPGYSLPIGTSFHPAYYESSSYSDHAVDSPLGNYFSEMTCNEFVN